MASAGNPVRLVRVAYSPVTQYYNHKIVVALSDDGTLDAYVYNGTAWAVSNNLADLWSGSPARSERPFDIVFSTTSGDALLVYAWYDDAVNDLAYRRWFANNQSWSAQLLLDDTTQFLDADYSFIILSPDPTSNSNYIGVVALDQSNDDVVAWTWSGSAFGNQTQLTGTVSANDREDIGIAFDYTGKMMIAAGEGANEVIRWNQWTIAGGWGTSQATSDIDPGENRRPYYVTLKADPSTDDLMLTVLDDGNDVHSLYWNGASWTIYANQDVDVDTRDQRCVDFDWEPSGGKGIQVRGTIAGQITWRTWTTGAGWGADNNPIMGANAHPWVQLRRNPRNVNGDAKILGAVLEDSVNDLGAIKWDGTTFTVIGSSTFTGTTVTTYESSDLEFQLLGDPTESTSEVEFTGTSNTSVWSQVVWTVDSAWDTANVTVTLQLYNWNTLGYPTSGDGYTTYTSSATPNTDETQTQMITNNPQNYRDTSGNWKIKVRGVKSSGTQFQFKADWLEYKLMNAEYTSEVEFTGSSNTFIWTQLVWTVDSAWTTGNVSTTLQLYNYAAGSYPTSGDGYIAYTSSATSNVTETKSQTVTANPANFRDSSGNWKTKIKGVKSTPTQFDFKADLIELESTGDATPPVWSNARTNDTAPGLPTLFSVRWTDNAGLSGFIFGTNDTGTWVNSTWTPMSGTANWSNVTETINSTFGIVVQWRIWANDTSNNWDDTGILTFKTLQAPTASFTHSPSTPLPGETVLFNASDSSDPDGTIVSYSWDFGDGNITAVFNPTLNHIYQSSGSYQATLTVFDDNGYSNSFSKILTVGVHNVAILSVSSSATEVRAGQQVNVTVVVKNKGTIYETFNVTIYYNNTILKTLSVADLAPSAEITLTFNWNTNGLIEGAIYTIRAETSQILGEMEPADNNLTGSSVKISQISLPPPNSFWDTLQPYAIPLGAIIGSFLLLAAVAVLRRPNRQTANPAETVPSQLQPFVDMIGGELPDAYSVMIVGDASAGKSILCQQLAYRYLSLGKPCVYVTYECFPGEIRENMKGFRWDISAHEQNGSFVFVDCYSSIAGIASQEKYFVKQPFALSELGIVTSTALEGLSQKSARVFLDSTAPIFTRLESSRVVEFLQDRSAQIKGENGTFFFIVGKGTLQEDLRRKLEEIVDCIIELEVHEEKGETVRKMHIKKLRGRRFTDQWVPFKVDMKKGFVLSAPKHSQKSQR
jgi:KaiC/GvpD/RAD55 family RecA-like ATPase/PKD repeat protein